MQVTFKITKNVARLSAVAACMTVTLAARPLAVFAAAPAPSKVGVNLLENPGHEHPGAYFDNRGELNVTWNWVPFWQEPPPGVDLRDQSYRTPEFRPPFARDFPDRVKSGGGSDRWFNYFALNKAAGVMQVVKDLPVGAPVRFTSHIQLWSSTDNVNPPNSKNHGNELVRLCMMQGGGPRDMSSPLLKCSDWAQPYDKWAQLSVDGVAYSPEVIAFAQTTAEIPVEHNDAYMDESCFEVLPKAGAKGVCKGVGLIETGRNAAITPAAPQATYLPNANVAEPAKRALTVAEEAMLKGKFVFPKATKTTTPAKPTKLVNVPVKDASGTGTVMSKKNLNVRGGAGTLFPLIGTLKSGSSFTVTGTTANGWLRVNYNGKPGYVLASLTDYKP